MKKYNKSVKIIGLLFAIFFLFPFFAPYCSATTIDNNIRIRQLEIIKQEISLLRNLIKNINSLSSINASSYIVVDISNNKIIARKNSLIPYSIASITKLMTGVIAQENINLNDTIVITPEMLQPYGYSPAIFNGLSISAENLLYASLIQSTNDAAESLSYFLGNDYFIYLMNEKAKELKMNNTIFYDVHGLNPNNRSTVNDIYKLLLYIYEYHPDILEITKNNNFWLPDANGELLKFRNLNNFYPIPGFIGGKTGYLPEAKQTFAGIFNINNKEIAVIVLYSTNRQADVFSLLRK